LRCLISAKVSSAGSRDFPHSAPIAGRHRLKSRAFGTLSAVDRRYTLPPCPACVTGSVRPVAVHPERFNIRLLYVCTDFGYFWTSARPNTAADSPDDPNPGTP